MASGTTLHDDPDLHPDDTLKAFNEFIQSFYLRYEAQYPDPPKVFIDAAIERWKLANDTAKPTLEQYDALRNEWRSKDRVAKFLRMSIIEHVKTCRAKTSKCNFCDTIEHYESVCRKKKAVRELTSITPESQLRSEEDAEESGIYNINTSSESPILIHTNHATPVNE